MQEERQKTAEKLEAEYRAAQEDLRKSQEDLRRAYTKKQREMNAQARELAAEYATAVARRKGCYLVRGLLNGALSYYAGKDLQTDCASVQFEMQKELAIFTVNVPYYAAGESKEIENP